MVISEMKKYSLHVQVVEFGHMKSAADSTCLIVVCFSFLKIIFVHGKFYN
jgi:hypothetical protein